jgi:hypothetical protein
VTEFRFVRRRNSDDDDDSSSGSSDDGKWVLVGSQRAHTHDVHALALAPPTKVVARAARKTVMIKKSSNKLTNDDNGML